MTCPLAGVAGAGTGCAVCAAGFGAVSAIGVVVEPLLDPRNMSVPYHSPTSTSTAIAMPSATIASPREGTRDGSVIS